MNNHDGKEVKNTWLFKHGHRGRSDEKCSKTYNTWMSMKDRCLKESHHNYPLYGGAGIRICDEWMSFSNFIKDMGERPEGTTIDRIDPSLGYFKNNCRWATSKEQAENRRTTKKFLFNGSLTYAGELSRIYGVSNTTLRRRLATGLTGDDLIKPARKKAKNGERNASKQN